MAKRKKAAKAKAKKPVHREKLKKTARKARKPAARKPARAAARKSEHAAVAKKPHKLTPKEFAEKLRAEKEARLKAGKVAEPQTASDAKPKSRGRLTAKEKAFVKELERRELPPQELEARRTRLKNLIALGKERGYLTYAEINDHLPDDMLDADQIEGIISMINDMAIQVYDKAPDAETLLMSEATPPVADEDAVEEAEAALSTVDSEFGRTTDPVRMYMREMGSVELLTREGEIKIAKRIEEGLRFMIQAIS